MGQGNSGFKAVLDDLKDDDLKKIVESEAAEMQASLGARDADSLQRLNKQEADLVQSPKAAL